MDRLAHFPGLLRSGTFLYHYDSKSYSLAPVSGGVACHFCGTSWLRKSHVHKAQQRGTRLVDLFQARTDARQVL
jgi:hypothetical protein